ncbi:hypothetical protein [Zhaonella formicivorans]|uniref:hypothetical protein n=1 Tax=Zhaonella formicivorans TaxID=2528593 RepID=UPI0010E09375|nr:hypothetical protein [Zhaonella formicivorans]
MKVQLKIWGMVMLFCVGLLGVAACGQTGEVTPPAGEQTGSQVEGELTSDFILCSSEDLPAGCLSCHKKFNENADLSLPTIMANLEQQGRHPEAPDQCLLCHQTSGALPLGSKLHATHYLDGCVQCHKLNEKGDFVALNMEPAETAFIAVKASAKDVAPHGCGDCHRDGNGNKALGTLETALDKLGSHPPVGSGATVNQCRVCHQDGELALGKIMHKSHYQGENNLFITEFGGSCRNCHSVGSDYTISIKE